MVGNKLSLADLSVLSGLKSNHSFNVVLDKGKFLLNSVKTDSDYFNVFFRDPCISFF